MPMAKLNKAPWAPCNCCDDYMCSIHQEHVYDCECPPLEEWTVDPYGLQAEGPANSAMIGQLSSTDIDAIEARWIDKVPRTHWENCHLTHGHQSCAIARLLLHIKALEAENSAHRKEKEQ